MADPARRLPTGTITFVFTDIEGSTRMLSDMGPRYQAVLEAHQAIIREAVARHDGVEVSTEGDSFFCVFTTAEAALSSAADIQRAMAAHDWGAGDNVRVRIGVHTGTGTLGGDAYVGLDVHRAARIGEAGHGGQVVLSASTRILGEAALTDGVSVIELGEFHLRDLDRPEHLFQLVVDDLEAAFPPLRRLATGPSNLPAMPSSFVGRDRERRAVEKLLSEARLLTVTGLAGAGKSRLAIEVATGARHTFRDGVWFVELAAVSNDDLVAQAVVHAMGLRESPGRVAIDVLSDFLREQTCLLVLDNCEHVVLGVGELARRLIATAPDLRILATSRQVLGIPGETRYPCPPLEVPQSGSVSVERLLDFDAVELFQTRAREVDPSFSVDDENAATVAAICRRLDGVPLAIELAASLIRVLTPEAILQRLDRRFELLTGGPRTAPSHQQTLRAALDSTFEALDEGRREFARRLGVFVGSFDVAAAEAVASGGNIERHEVVDALSALVDRSLVTMSQSDRMARLTILESVRAYLRTELDQHGELEERSRRHASYYAELVRDTAGRLRGAGQDEAAARMDTELENIRAAISFLADAGDQEALQMVNRLFLYWVMRGDWSDGLHWTRHALEGTPKEDSGLRARMLATAGFFASDLGQADRGISDLEAGLAMAKRVEDLHAEGYCSSFLGAELSRRDLDLDRGLALLSTAQRIYSDMGEPYGEAWVNRYLGLSYQERGDFDQAIELQTMALKAFREAGDSWNIRRSLALLAEAMHTIADLPRSRELYEESLEGSADPRFKVVIANALKGLGKVSLAEGKLDEAHDHLTEALGELHDIGDMAGSAETRGHIAMVELGRGHRERAGRALVEVLMTFLSMNDQGGVAWALERLAAVAAAQGSHDRAAQLLGAGAAIRERVGSVRPWVDQLEYDDLADDLRRLLGNDAYEVATSAGMELDLDESVALGAELA